MPNSVIEKVREKYPQYGTVPDDELTDRIAHKYPDYLDVPDFEQDYQRILGERMKSDTTKRELQKGDAPVPYSEEIPRNSDERAARNFYNQWALTGKAPTNPDLKTGREPLLTIPRITGQIVHDAMEVAARYQYDPAHAQQKLGESPQTPPTTADQLIAGSVNAINAATEGLTTPENIAILPFAAEKSLAKPVAAYFYTHLLQSLPETAKRAGEISVTGTPEQKAEAYVGLGVHMGMAAMAGSHAVKPVVPKSVELAKALDRAEMEAVPISPISPITLTATPELKALAPATAAVIEKSIPSLPIGSAGEPAKLTTLGAKLDLEPAKAESAIEPEVAGAISTPGPPLSPSTAPPVPLLTPKSQRQIITDLARGLNVPIRFGRLRTNKFGGYYMKVANLIGSKKANDIPIVTHEAGHRLDAEFKFSVDPALTAELDALGDPTMPGSRSSWTKSKTHKYKLGEGVAEFTRHWLTDPIVAQRHAPNMLRAFEAALDANKDFGDTMRQAQSDIKAWRDAPAQARLRSHISVGSNPNKTPYTLSQLTRDVVDDLNILKLLTEDAAKAGPLPANKNPYLLARTLRGSYGMADTFIRKGVTDFKTKAVTLGTSMEHALQPVAGRIADFRDWIVAKRAQELRAQGRATGLVPADVDFTAARFDADPAFNEAFTKLKAWQDAILQYAVDSGLVTDTGAAAMRQMNQDYVPFHRVFEVGAGEPPAVEGSGTGRGLNVGTPGSLKRLKGSPRDIVDPLETMVRNAYTIITAAEKSAINRAVADMSRLPDMGKWVEPIATPKEFVKVTVEKIRDQLEDAGADLTQVPDDLMVQFFQNSKQAPFGENVIAIARDGKPEFYRLNGDLFETFHALNLEDSGTLVRILSEPAQVLRAGVTLDPAFALSNVIRDAVSSAMVSRHGLFPFEAAVRGVISMLRDPKLIAEWQAAGGKNSIEANYFDRAKLQQFLAEKITKDLTPAQRALVIAKSPLAAMRMLTGLGEEATRIGEYQKTFNDLRKQGMPEGEARRLAAFESRDRQDFAKGGAKTKIPRRLAAFWNASLQGNIRLAQAFKESPFKTSLKGLAYITIPKLLEQSLNWNDPDYWDRPQWERDLFLLVPIGKDDADHTRFFRFPIAFLSGVIFGTLPGRILQTIREQNPDAMKTFPGLVLKEAIPNPTPQIAQTFFETFLSGKQGRSVFRDRPIVPDSVAQLPPEMQFTAQTSLTAKNLGAAFAFSPMKIDHIINSTTGGLGKQVTHQLVDRAIEAATSQERTAKGTVPGGRFITTPANVSSQSIEDFYTTLDRIKTAAAGEKKGKPAELAAWLKDFTKTERQLSELRKEMRAAPTEEEKNAVAEAILTLARETMKAFRAAP